MFAISSGKPVWYLPFAIFVTLFLLCSSIGYWNGGHSRSNDERYPERLTAIFSTNTIDALNQDPRLRDALLSLTEAIAQSSTDLGERLRLDSLRDFGTNLTDGIVHVRNKQQSELKKRGMMEDMSEVLGDVMSGGANSSTALNMTGGLSGILSSLGGAMGDSFATPALFLGIGLGMGTSTALNLTDMQEANAIATKIATAYNATATGTNLAAQNLGSGLAGQITPSFDNSNVSIGLATYALASGIGNATAMGLGLTKQQYFPSTDMSIEGLAGNLGLGVAMPIVSKIDIQAVMKSFSDSIGASMFMQQLPEIASAAGMGLGEGARNGLGLSVSDTPTSEMRKRQFSNATSERANLPEAIGSFAKGLSQSFIQGSNLSSIGTVFPSSTFDLQTMLTPIAAGAGAGVGMGVAIGLNLKSADATPMLGSNIAGEDEKRALAAESFAQNLFSNFLMNSTAIKQAQKFIASNPPQAFKDVNSAQAAEGFARGTIEGVMSAMSSVGGIKNLISGQVSPNAFESVPVLAPTQFNDSVNGSAVAFARGMMGKATILIAEVARNLTQSPQNTSMAASPSKRSLDDDARKVSLALSPRQAQRGDGVQIPVAIDAGTVQMGGQKLIDTITCQGVGGIASAAFGAMNAAKAKASMMDMAMGAASAPLDPTVLQSLPRGPIALSSEGNMFEIVIEQQSLKINGKALLPFAIITGLHVLFAGLAFLTFLPLYLILGVVWRFSVMAGYPVNEAKNRKWRLGFLLTFAILGITGMILGVVGMGNAQHFRDTHGIIGLVCLILIFPAVGFTIVRLRTDLPHPSPAFFAGAKAPIALAKTPQRIYLISGIFTQLILGLGQFAFIQGFATLRAISLCIVDAVLTSASVASLISFVLMIQIGATALVGIRAWLEQHIAKKEAAGIERTMTLEAGEKARMNTMQTFGFDRKDPPPALDLTGTKPRLVQRKTEELKGSEDVDISTPFNVRKEGSLSSPAGPRNDPFLSPEEQLHYENRGIYNPKTGGYTYATPIANTFSTSSGHDGRNNDGKGRPSSDLFDPMSSPRPPIAAGPKTENVSTADLWPPPMPRTNPPSEMFMTQKSMTSSYSRPFDGKTPVRDSFMGFEETFGRGPGGTIREKR